MKKLRTILTILFLSLILGGMTSCEVSRHSENGHRRGWFRHHDYDDHRRSAVIVIDKDNRDHRSDDHHDNH